MIADQISVRDQVSAISMASPQAMIADKISASIETNVAKTCASVGAMVGVTVRLPECDDLKKRVG